MFSQRRPPTEQRPGYWRRLATGHGLPVWMSVVCLCMLNLRRWRRWLTTHKLNKSGDTEWMEFCFCYFRKKVGNKTTSTAVTDKRIVHDNKRAERRLTHEMQMKSQTKQRWKEWKRSRRTGSLWYRRSPSSHLRLNRPAALLSDSSLPTSWLSLLTPHISVWLRDEAQRPRS